MLGVPRDADQSEIQRSYRKLARTHHPDVNKDPSAEAHSRRFLRRTTCSPILISVGGTTHLAKTSVACHPTWIPKRGVRHVPMQEQGPAVQDREPRWSGGGVRYSDAPRRHRPRGSARGHFGGRGRTNWGPIPGSDQEIEAEITVEEAYHGTQRSLTISGPDGAARTLDINIPAGGVDGQRIRLRGQGGRSANGGQSGDLYLIVRIAPHPRYRVSGRDLTAVVPLSPWEAALGAAVRIDTPGGSHDCQRSAGNVQWAAAATEGPRTAKPPRRAG